jgi:hypothetical protein
MDYEDLDIDGGTELALRRAGVPPSELARVFAKSYSGDWSPDDVAEAYQALSAEVTGAPAASDREAAQHRAALQDGSSIGDTGAVNGPGRRQAIIDRARQSFENGGRARDDAMGDAVGEMIGLAAETGYGVVED